MAYQKTLILLKPGVREQKIVGKILTRFENKQLDICACKLIKSTKELMSKHYAEHKGKSFYNELVKYMSSGSIFALVVGGENAIAICRGLIGATDPLNALPGSIRGDFALKMPENIVHASDSTKSAVKEIKTFFKPSEVLSK